MSVRHIHAKQGEYIAVHRKHGNGSSSGGRPRSGGDNGGCLWLLATVIVIWVIANFWEILVTLAILCAAIWLIWTFRHPIWRGVCWISKELITLTCTGFRGLQSYLSRKKLLQQAVPHSNMSGDYGKIRQYRR